MTLAAILALRKLASEGEVYREAYIGIDPFPTFHPPSLKHPVKVKQDLPSDGWHKNDSHQAKQLARQDLQEILKRIRRQTGKPEIAHTAISPVFPGPVG